MRAAIADPSYTRFLLQLGRWIEAGGWREDATPKGAPWLDRPIVAFADRLLARRHRKALKLGRRFEDLTPPERHRLRIALKKLRYATEFFDSLHAGKRARPYLAALKELQDALGHLNDVAVAERLLRGLSEPAGEQRAAIGRASGLVLGLARPRRRRGRAGGPGRLADLRRAQTILELTRDRARSIHGR